MRIGNGRMTATEEPYMRPAFEEGQEAAVEAVKTSFEKKII